MKLNAKELRDVDETDAKVTEKLKSIKRRPMYFILENIYDTYNIGGLFRLADALAIEKMYICGESEIPPNSKIKKASIGTYKVVPWEYAKTVEEVVIRLRSQYRKTSDVKRKNDTGIITEKHSNDIQIIAVEQHKTSVPYTMINYSEPVALILGNETSGIMKETLALVDHIAEIPMWGINKSLNVIVSAAIVSYWAVSQT